MYALIPLMYEFIRKMYPLKGVFIIKNMVFIIIIPGFMGINHGFMAVFL